MLRPVISASAVPAKLNASPLYEKRVPGSVLDEAPMLRGRLVRLKDVPVEDVKAPPEAQWVLNGDRGLSYADEVPRGSRVVAGEWWPADYSGPPLVSLRDRAMTDLKLKAGDKLELTLFGESIEVTVANFREFQFQSGLNFLVTASPGTFDDFPGTNLATIKTKVGEEKNIERALARRYPDITFIPVGDALNQAASILSQTVSPPASGKKNVVACWSKFSETACC